MQASQNIEFTILIIAAAAFVLYGFFGSRALLKEDNVELGWLKIAAGFSMSFIGGAATIAMAGIGYANGLIGFIDPVAVLIGGLVVMVWIGTRSSPTIGQGIAHYLASGNTTRTTIYSVCSFSVYILLASAQIVALMAIFSPYIGEQLATALSIALFAGIAAYVFFGGISAVTRTDVVQFLVVSTLFFLPALYGIVAISSEIGSQTAIAQSSLDLRTVLLLSLSFLFVPLSQDVWIRIRGARSQTSARIGVVVGALLYFLIVGASVVLGDQAAQAGLIVDDPEQVLTVFFVSELGIAGVVTTVVILAAILSSLDSFTYNLNSTVFEDLVSAYVGEAKKTRFRILTAVLVFFLVVIVATAAASILGLVLTALMIYVSVIGPGYVMAGRVRREISLWLPALVTLTAIISFSLFSITIPYEPYSLIAAHFLLIFAMMAVERMTGESGTDAQR